MTQAVRTGCVEFGRRLIETEDLDPLYVGLWRAPWDHDKLCRWLVAYWCFYHAGLCCWLSEQEDRYWSALLQVAQGGTDYPRGTERRHFRGKLAVTSVTRLGEQFADATELVAWVAEAGPRADSIMKRVTTLYGFGEWIKWKVPDMLERLALAPVRFVDRDCDLMFDSSLKGARVLAEEIGQEEDGVMSAHRHLIRELGGPLAPPRYERRINVQETETIFCKWKSSFTGHYPLGKDILEIRHGLTSSRLPCRTTQELLEALPRWEGGG